MVAQLFTGTILLIYITFFLNDFQCTKSLLFPYNQSVDQLLIEKDVTESKGKIWAVLVAGSSNWYNYRHQADVAHAYHILVDHGIPSKQIITMMYDDIAFDPNNPFPGKLYNDPFSKKNVYSGVYIDYKGKAVTPDNFMAILLGQHEKVKGGNGRVLESTSNDKVFINFVDHGGEGLIAFPDRILTVKQLKDTLMKMQQKKMYKELVFYLEACESGSMFDEQLEENQNIYAVTASNGTESSWGCYCDNNLIPGVCLGDLFSVNWMEDSDKENLRQETLEQQYTLIRKETNASHVCEFGDMAMTMEDVGEFQGEGGNGTDTAMMDEKDFEKMPRPRDYAMYPVHDIPLAMLRSDFERAKTPMAKDKAIRKSRRIIKNRRWTDRLFKSLATEFSDDTSPNSHERLLTTRHGRIRRIDCHNDVVNAFHDQCLNLAQNTYILRHVNVLTNLCEMNDEMPTESIVHAMVSHCQKWMALWGDKINTNGNEKII